jgi:5'-nucleotidase (lipoprotein e(P4) family)
MKHLWLFGYLLLCSACSGPKHNSSITTSSVHLVVDGKLWSSVFQQRAAEYKALCFQAYNIAKLRLDEALKADHSKPLAVITDIDETVLDNSPFAVHQGLQGKDYDAKDWSDWTSKGSADTLAGALSFFTYASTKGVEVFYISNRREAERPGTLRNLQRLQFPYADEQHLILRKDEASKESRRLQVASTHSIVLLLGDNLADFTLLFDKKLNSAERVSAVQDLAMEFGKRFIMLPNANYGGWEDALYGNNYGLSSAQKDSAIRANLKNY